MSMFRIQMPAALACLALSASAFGPSFAYDGRWYVNQDPATQTCYRETTPTDQKDWRTLADFDTFREAGTWIWMHSDSCAHSAAFF